MTTRSAGAAAATVILALALLIHPGTAASAAVPVLERREGSDRYATSARISAVAFPGGASTVYIASGTEFPDALSGAAAAGVRSAPVLLVRPDAVPSVIDQELNRLNPANVVVLGGEGAVSAEVLDALAAVPSRTVTRLSGPDRYATSAAVSATFTPGVAVAFLANGEDFPDALSGASVAGMRGGPILLTTPGSLPEVVSAELARLRPQRLIVLGGVGAVSEEVANAAAAAAAAGAAVPIDRISDSDRYGTSAQVSARTFAPGVPVVYLASGVDFPDALSGGAAARGAPVLLTRPGALSASVALELMRLKPGRIVVLGGTGAVSGVAAEQAVFAGGDLPAATGGRLTAANEVRAGECLASPDGTHRLCVGAGGGLTVVRGSTTLWNSGATAAPRSLRIRADGNLVLYSLTGTVVWESSTRGSGATELLMQNDGDVMLRSANGSIWWSTMTSAAAPRWRLPFANGQSWAAGGPHANSGNTVAPRSALDFGPVSGGDRRVLSIAPGTVYGVNCGSQSYLGVLHAGGWQSTYYHLVNYQTHLIGTSIPAGTYLGDVGRTVPCGGGATFDHVHLVIRRAGQPVGIEGMTFGGYQVRSSGTDYWGYWTRDGNRVLTAPGGAACCLTAQ